jgi:hypothetical protein
MIPSKHLYLTIAATTAALLTGLPAANAAATIEAASGNGAGLVLSMSLLGTTVATATLPGNVTLLGNQSPVATGTAVTGSTTNGTPYHYTSSVANLNLTGTTALAIPAQFLPTAGSPLITTTVSAKTTLSANVLDADTSFSNGSLVKSVGGVTNLDLGTGVTTSTKTTIPGTPETTMTIPGAPGTTPYLPVGSPMTIVIPAIPESSSIKNTSLFSLGLTADALQSTSQISMINGLLQGTNTLNSFTNVSLNLSSLLSQLSLTSLRLSGSSLGSAIDLSAIAGANPQANTMLVDNTGSLLTSLGIKLTLNEQFNTCATSLTSCFVETNALHLVIDPLIAGLAAVDLKLGHSYAAATSAVSAVPEPSTYAMLGLGLVAVMLGARRQRRRSSVLG